MTSREFMYMDKNMFTFEKSALLQNVCKTNINDVCIENKIEKRQDK